MNILVAGVTGEIGGQVMRALQDRGVSARPFKRPNGDLEDRASIQRALIDCQAAVFITPHHEHEEQLGHNFIDACEAADIRRIVYVSLFHWTSRSRVIQRLLDGLTGAVAPHYKAKLRIERRVRASRTSPVVLAPTHFYQNDELGMPEILAGVYPHPIGARPLSRIDTRDIGDGAARAILDDVAPGVYPMLGPDSWTGDTCAALWADVLGMPVRYDGNIEHWRGTVGARMPTAKAADFAKTYRVLQKFGPIAATPSRIARTTELLGRPPRSYRDYVTERIMTMDAKRSRHGGI